MIPILRPFFPSPDNEGKTEIQLLICTKFPLVTACALFSALTNTGVLPLSLALASSPKSRHIFHRIFITYLLSVPSPATCRAFPFRFFIPATLSFSYQLIARPCVLPPASASSTVITEILGRFLFTQDRLIQCSFQLTSNLPSIFLTGLTKALLHNLSLLSPCIPVISRMSAPAATGLSPPTSIFSIN